LINICAGLSRTAHVTSDYKGGLRLGAVSYNVHRWYTPGTGRYTQADPIHLFAGPLNNPGSYVVPGHAFLYGAGNPLRFSDPLGLAVEDALCTLKWTLAGGLMGSLAGAGTGCLAGGTAGTLVAPGVGTLGGCGGGALAGAVLGGIGGAFGGTIGGTIACRCPDGRGRSRSDRWTCEASCHVNNFSGVPGAPAFVSAMGSGPSETLACQSAITAAQAMSPRGTYTRHCRCTHCWRR